MDRRPFRFLLSTTFRSLRHRDYRLYFVGQIVSFTGSWMQNAALMWFVFDRTGNPIWPPLLLVAQVGPTLLLGTWGGNLADRTPKRRLILRTQTAFLLNAGVLTALVGVGAAVPGAILALQLLNGVIQAVDLPARLAFVPDLVPRDDLINAVALNSLLFNSARAVGPAVTGQLFFVALWLVEAGLVPGWEVVSLGAVLCFGANAVSYAAVLAALARIRTPGVRPPKSDPGSALDGWRAVRASPVLTALLLLTGGVCVFGWPAVSLFPAYTRLVLGLAETEYSQLVSGLGAGALGGALGTAAFGTAARRGAFFTAGTVGVAAGLGGLAVAGTLPVALGSAACLGFGMILFLSTGQSTMQLGATDASRGRVMALWAMTLSASAPVGHLLAGLSAAAVGVTTAFAGMAAGAAVVAAAALGITLARGWKVEERP
jgi:Na+/melibiose symporter-like transporter